MDARWTASTEEVIAALNALADADRLRLRGFARWRVKGLGRAALGRTFEDLLGDAITAILGGRRHWDPAAVPFLGFLLGVVRSISSHWRESFDEEEAHLDCEVRSDRAEDGPVELARSNQPGADRQVAARSQLDAINKLFEDDHEALLVIEGLGEGMSGPEIQQALGMSSKDYDATVKRMRRRVRQVFGEGGQGHA